MSGDRILVGPGELGRFIRDVLMAKGARERDAAAVAEGLVWANLRGGDGHGVSRLPRYLKLIDNGEIDMKVEPRLTQDRGASFVLDCGHGFGPVAVKLSEEVPVPAARSSTRSPGRAPVIRATARRHILT
ncbi:MAG: Ldh family oxidoreductase, partial [Xanthobacteraceae bacterium]